MSESDAGGGGNKPDWINEHLGKSSRDTTERLLSTPQPQPDASGPRLRLHSVRGRCVAGGSSNFWIVGSEAAEPLLDGEFPLIGIAPTAYFVAVARFNDLPYAVRRAELTPSNHAIVGDTAALEAAMKEVYG
jgi:hypothetical protein